MTLHRVDRVPTPVEHRRLAMPASLAASVCGVVVVLPKAFVGLFAAGDSPRSQPT